MEARSVGSIRKYLSDTFYERLQKTPEQMRGRRILSNPPGMTVLSVLAQRAVVASPKLKAVMVRTFGLEEANDTEEQTEFAGAMLLAVWMTALWGAGFFFAYALVRMWLSPLAAVVMAFACVVNPATLCYTPGKDCMQLLSVLAITCFCVKAYMQHRALYGALLGVVVPLSLLVGLIHLWVVAIVLGATLWDALGAAERRRDWIRSVAAPSVGGFAVTSVGLYLLLGWNVVRCTYRVGVRYGEIQLPIITEPPSWVLVGLPLFLLFAGPCLLAMLGIRRDVSDGGAALGRRILLLTAVVMTYSYFFANNSETVRLWMPFVPLLLLGMVAGRSIFRNDTPSHRALVLVLAVLHISVTLGQWSLMDVRESEWRLTTGRMWD